MPSPLDVLISTGAGFVAGILGSTLNERLKSSVLAIESELARLDGLHDKIADVLTFPSDLDRSTTVREAASIRRRVGINFRSLMPDSVAYSKITALLSRLDRIIGRAEDGQMLTAENEAELDEVILGIRSTAKASSSRAAAWRLLRGG